MKGTTKVFRAQWVFGTVLAIGLTSTAASADVYVTGTLCTEAGSFAGNVLDFNGGFASNPTSTEVFVTCPIPVAQNLGTTHSFEVRVQDNHATQNFTSWIGLVLGTNGEILASTGSGQVLGTGELTMTFSTTTAAATDDYSYVALGLIPGNGSQVEILRVQ